MDRWRTFLWVLLATGLGAVLRLVALGFLPPGLYQDEAYNGLDALRVLAGEYPLYFAANNGREPLFIYLASLSVAGLGPTPAALRLPAALLGTLTIPASALLASSLLNRRVGVITAMLVAVTLWPLHLSRIAFRAVGWPLFAALAMAAGWHGAQRQSRGWVFAGGLLYGLAFYTYLPVYFSLVVLALLALYLWVVGYKAQLRAQLRSTIPWFVIGAALAAAPLAIAAFGDPSLLFGRTGQVAILNPAVNHGDLWGTLCRQVGRALGMFFWRGDTIPRHNLPGRPVFDPLVAPFLLLGVYWAARKWRSPAAALILLWPLVMLAPTILAEDAPHFLRAVGVLPVACLLPAVGLEQTERWLARHLSGRWVPVPLTALILAGSLGLTVRDYFGRYVRDPLTDYAFQGAAVELAERIRESDGAVWASERFAREWQAIPFLIADREVHWLARDKLPRPASLPAALFVWPYDRVEPQLRALPAGMSLEGWRGPLIRGDLEPEPYPLYWAYRMDRIPEPPAEPVARFEGGIRLESAVVISRTLSGSAPPADDGGGAGLEVILHWTTEQNLDAEYVVFVHIVDESGIVAQDDSIPAAGTLPTSWWRPGDLIVDAHSLEGYDPERHTVIAGLYGRDSRARLAVLDPAGRVVGDAVTLMGNRAPAE